MADPVTSDDCSSSSSSRQPSSLPSSSTFSAFDDTTSQASTASSQQQQPSGEPDSRTMERFRQTFTLLIDSLGTDPGGEYLRTFIRDIARSDDLGRVFPVGTWESRELFSLLTRNWINEFYPVQADQNAAVINQVRSLLGKPNRPTFEDNLNAIHRQHWRYFRPVLEQAGIDPHMEYDVFLAEMLSGLAVLQHLEDDQPQACELIKYRMVVGATWYVLPRIIAQQDLASRLTELLEDMVEQIQADQCRANLLLLNAMLRAMVKTHPAFRYQAILRPEVVYNGLIVYFTNRVPVLQFPSSSQLLFTRNGKASYRPVVPGELILSALTDISIPVIPIEEIRTFQNQFSRQLLPIAHHFNINLDIHYTEAVSYLAARLLEVDFDTKYKPQELKSMAIMATIILPALAAQLRHRASMAMRRRKRPSSVLLD